jgi:outer membrane protein insertion porin family
MDIELGFTEPYMFGRPISGGFDIFTNSSERDDKHFKPFDKKSKGFTLRSGYNLTENLSHNVHYDLVMTNVSNLSKDASVYMLDQKGKRTNSLIGHGFNYDRRDRAMNPSEGYIISLNQDFAGVGGTAKFLRHSVAVKSYFPIVNDDVVLLVAADAGHMRGVSGKKINIVDRFFVGGADSLRGFDSYGIGPRAKDKNTALGGDVFYKGTTELKFPLGIGKELGLFGSVFADAGTLYKVDVADKGGIWDSRKIRSAYGFGIGFSTPMGPIRVHYAIPISKAKFDETKNFDITFRTDF